MINALRRLFRPKPAPFDKKTVTLVGGPLDGKTTEMIGYTQYLTMVTTGNTTVLHYYRRTKDETIFIHESSVRI